MRYTIRYRCDRGESGPGLIVQAEEGTAYLFAGGRFQCRASGPGAPDRLPRALARPGRWTAVPRVAPFTLGGLRRLTGRPAPGGTRGDSAMAGQ